MIKIPYVKKEKRESLDTVIFKVRCQMAHQKKTVGLSPGDMNYIITKIVDAYIQLNGRSYSNLNECIGVLECAKQELYRRIIIPYEDEKREVNGDVYTQ